MRAEGIEQVAVNYVDLFGIQCLFQRLDACNPRLYHVQPIAQVGEVLHPAAAAVYAENLDIRLLGQHEIKQMAAREACYARDKNSQTAPPNFVHTIIGYRGRWGKADCGL